MPRTTLTGAGLAIALLLAPAAAPGQEPGAAASPGARTASGTAWQPDATPARAVHAEVGGWRLMLHGGGFLAYVREESFRGGAGLGSTNWAMVAANRAVPGGTLALVAAGSLETLTLGRCGYPRLLSTGPSCSSDYGGDFQHPHPPLMELAARYRLRIGEGAAVEAYGALVGEPAFGPPVYLHRLSAAADPIAPISHHEMSPSHASAGVLTAGAGGAWWKVEASAFHGAAPDPERLAPRPGPLESVAARVSVNPTAGWALQASVARIAAGAAHHEGATGRIRSASLSATHHRAVGRVGVWATTAAWARMSDGTVPRASILLESSLSLAGTHTLSARLESADRFHGRVTVMEAPDGSHDHLVEGGTRRVAQFSAGYLVERTVAGAAAGVGARASLSLLPEEMHGVYGRRRALGFALFAALRPALAAEPHPHE